LLLGLTISSFGMLPKTITTKTEHHRTYLITNKKYDPKKGRQEAYQKWCTTPITWNDNNTYQQLSQNQNNNHQKVDAMAYFKQFCKKS